MIRGMLTSWLGPSPLSEFRETCWRKAPRAGMGGAAQTASLLDWPLVARLLPRCQAGALVVREGRLLRAAPPETVDGAKALMASGWSVVLRGTEEHDEGLARVARSFESLLGGRAAVQLYLTPPGFQSFGWHYDAEDVFIAQASGVKDYRFRENTVNPRPRAAAMPKDMEYERETAPQLACRLAAGDWLYLPSGWWHTAVAESESLSLSVGLQA